MEAFNRKRYFIARILSIISTVGLISSFILMEINSPSAIADTAEGITSFMWGAGLVAAYICGGFLAALKLIWSFVVKTFYFGLEIFYVGIALVVPAFFVGVLVVLLFPVIPVWIASEEYI